MLVGPHSKRAFVIHQDGQAKYHCRNCSKYRRNTAFYPSYLVRQFRTCKRCLRKKERNRPQLKTLKRKLYKALWSRGEKGVAQLVTERAIASLLLLRGTEAQHVARLKPPSDPRLLLNLKHYQIIRQER